MSVKSIYRELALNMDDEYYIKLAKSEILTIPVLIDIMLEESFTNANRAQQLLEKISESIPETVYPFWSYIVQGLKRQNSLLVWNVWKIIANLVCVDSYDRWNTVSDDFFDALCSENITEFSIACDCAQKIIAAKPCESEKISNIIKSAPKRAFKIGGEVSSSCQVVAAQKVQDFLESTLNM